MIHTAAQSTYISMSQIIAEFGSYGQPYKLSQFYKGGGKVPNINANLAIPISGFNKFSNYYGTTRYLPAGTNGFIQIPNYGYFSWTVPDTSTEQRFVIIGGGGSGTQGGFDNGDGGVGGHGGLHIDVTLQLAAGTVITGYIGRGGQNIWSGEAGQATYIDVPGIGRFTAAGGIQTAGNNAPGGGDGAWYVWCQDISDYFNHYFTGGIVNSGDSNLANSYYTALFGVRTGGYDFAYVTNTVTQYYTTDENGNTVPLEIVTYTYNGSSGIYGGGGGGGAGSHTSVGGTYSSLFRTNNGVGGYGGDGVFCVWY